MRPSFDITTPGLLKFRFNGNTSNYVGPIVTSREQSSGVTRRRPVGWREPTPYAFTKRYWKGASGVQLLRWPDGQEYYLYTGDVGMASGSAPINSEAIFNFALSEVDLESGTSGLANRALLMALANLKGKRVDLGVAFGERNQCARMVGDTARNIAKSIKSFRRGQFRDAWKALGSPDRWYRFGDNTKRLANARLMMQYGVRPLLSDVDGAARALAERVKEDWRVSAKGFGKEIRDRSVLKPITAADPIGFTSKFVGWRGAFVRIDAIPSNEILVSFTSLGLTNPLVLGWELLPFSFVVDWLLPIGSWLDALDSYFGYGNISVSTSIIVKGDWSINGESGPLSNGFRVVNDWVGSKKVVKLNRTITGQVLPAFPSFKNPASFGHMWNGLALLRQLF